MFKMFAIVVNLTTSLYQLLLTFLSDLGAAIRFVFNRRRFSFGFFFGWCSAFALNTLVVLYIV